VKLRLATSDDAALIFDWRNDETSRKASESSDPLDWIQHCEWLESRLESFSSEKVYIAEEVEGHPVAYGRIWNKAKNTATISICVDPSLRGEGIGTKVIGLLRDKIYEDKRTPVAIIKDTNVISQKAFISNGFKIRNRRLGWLEFRA
jgi:RimJ/RimL family protein N-acetyltransferase